MRFWQAPPPEKSVTSNLGSKMTYLKSFQSFNQIPPGISFDEAASVVTPLVTEFIGLYQQKPYGFGLLWPVGEGRGKYNNTPIVILGGSSSLGQAG